MGHCIRAFIGKSDVIQNLADCWLQSKNIVPLAQDFAMVYLTAQWFDDMTELADAEDDLHCAEMQFFTTAVYQVMQEHSFRSALAYIETDYFSGVGGQSGVLFENGEITTGPAAQPDIINQILHKLGACRLKGKDEFDSLSLGHYRRMPE